MRMTLPPLPDLKAMTTTIHNPNKLAAHIVLDIETLDVLPSAKIISIGAAGVSSCGVLVASFHIPISTISQQFDRTESQDTHKWWKTVPCDAARAASYSYPEGPETPLLSSALRAFKNFCDAVGNGDKHLRVWGNGSDFDNAIVQSLYKSCNMPAPWEFWNNRCLRTLRDLVPECKDVGAFVGVQHHAEHDALHEAKQLQKAIYLDALL